MLGSGPAVGRCVIRDFRIFKKSQERRKIMKKTLIFLSVLAMAFFLINANGPSPTMAQKKPVVIRHVLPTPEGDYPQTFRDKEMAKRFNERAKGEYVIEVYAGGALAKLPEYFDAVRIGAVEMEFSNWGMFSFLDPRMGLLEVPFLFNNNHATSAGMKLLLPLYDQILQEKFNAKGIAMMNTGGLGLWSKKPIKTLEGWKGLLTASVSPITSVLIKDLGGSPVTIVFFETYEALAKKTVDAAAQSAHGGVVFQFPDVCKYFTAFYSVPASAGYSINLDVWKKMPPHIQKILQEETARAADWMANVLVTELPDSDLKVFKEKGVTVYYLPKAERDKWAKQLEPYKEKQLSSFGDLGQKVKKIADDMNKKYPYVPNKGIM
jgi:TRAP-type C4-dicarboxylate transport system substrate-binding protein